MSENRRFMQFNNYLNIIITPADINRMIRKSFIIHIYSSLTKNKIKYFFYVLRFKYLRFMFDDVLKFLSVQYNYYKAGSTYGIIIFRNITYKIMPYSTG